MKPTTRCTCGDRESTYYPDENQYEPNCFECYYSPIECKPDVDLCYQQFLDESIDDLPF